MKREVVLVLTLIVVLWGSSAVAQGPYVTKGGYMAGVTEEAFDKGMDYVVQKDHAALQQLMDANLVFPLRAGIRVHIMKTKLLSGKVKIRPVGQTAEVWTVMEAIDRE